ncbi:MAG: hypothetical protein Q8M92_04700, partial [Candidatus Subteraquimicrobiales bacterium]|nr:hypothetical protein [Candidatus Subteraquimicrobiales bacterium]
GQTLYIDANYSDLDGDTGTFSDNSTKWNVNTGTGVVSWTTIEGDQGTYYWYIAVSDGYGSISYANFSVVVGDSTPGIPTNLQSTTGNFFINNTFNSGINTDTFNLSINNIWNNGSANTYNNSTLSAHAWANISVAGWNNTLKGLGSFATKNTQIPNNPVIIDNISSSYTIQSGQTLSIYPNSTDVDGDTPIFARNFTNGSFTTSSGNLSWVTTVADIGLHKVRINVSDANGSVSTKNFNIIVSRTLTNLLPVNESTGVSITQSLIWQEYPVTSYIYQISTDYQYLNIITQGSGSDMGYGNGTYHSGNIVLQYNTKYFWHVKNLTSGYTNSFEFTTESTPSIPGRLNISVYDESILSKQVLNYTILLYNTTSFIQKSSNTITGWTNFSSEISGGEYLIIAVPTGIFNNYYQRMVLSTSPANVTMYVPNSTSPNNINLISFSLLDVTGMFPFKTSTITLSKGGLIQEKSYFSADGTHPVYLLQNTNYQISIQNGDNLQVFNN